MKTLLAHLALRDAGCGVPQTGSDVIDIARQYFYITVRSIRWPSETDQRQPTSDPNFKETVSALFVPEETKNYIGKGFFETWCDTHGYFRPEISVVWLEFSLDGHTQRFESVHQIIDNGETVQFYSNRSPAQSHRPSLLEEHIREYSIRVPKRNGRAQPKELVAVRSWTWPSSLSRWPQVSGSQCARKKQQDKPVIRLGELENPIYSGLPQVFSDENAQNRGEKRESFARCTSRDDMTNDLTDDMSAMRAAPPIAVSSSSGSPQNDSAVFECTAPCDDPCMVQVSDNYNLVDPSSRAVNDPELSRETVGNQGDHDLKTTLNKDACSISSFPLYQNVLGVEGSRPWKQSTVVSEQSAHNGTAPAFALDADCSASDLTIESPNASNYTTSISGIRCHSIVEDIFRADLSFNGGSKQKGESGNGSMEGDHNGSTALEVPSPGRIGCREPDMPKREPHWLDEVSVRKDEPPDFDKSDWPAVASSAAISPAANHDRNTPEIHYTNAAIDTSGKMAADSDDGEQEPGESSEMAMWDLCHESDQYSIYSSDDEGLPFPDDYWVYDETVKNYYHVDVGDDGAETISWYPLEFD